jgi:transposase
VSHHVYRVVSQPNRGSLNGLALAPWHHKDGTWERLNRLLREKVRLKFGKKRQSSVATLGRDAENLENVRL